MPNKKHGECAISKRLDDDNDDLALPGETLDGDEQLRMEINLDRAMWNKCLPSTSTSTPNSKALPQ